MSVDAKSQVFRTILKNIRSVIDEIKEDKPECEEMVLKPQQLAVLKNNLDIIQTSVIDEDDILGMVEGLESIQIETNIDDKISVMILTTIKELFHYKIVLENYRKEKKDEREVNETENGGENDQF